MNSEKTFLADKIIGTWKYISWTYTGRDGISRDFFGEASDGILMYDKHGYMNAQLMRLPRANMAAQGLFEGDSEEIRAAYASYAAYYGRYRERAPGEFVHMVEGSLFPNWKGKEEVRYATIEDNVLTLSAPPVVINNEEVIFHVRWRKVHHIL